VSEGGVGVAAWDALYETFGTSPRYPHDAVIRWMFRTFGRPPRPRVKILDVGAGTGRHAIFLAQHGHIVTATDYSPMAMEIAAKWAAEEKLKIETATSGADSLPFPDNGFAGLLCYGVLCYLTPVSIKKAVDEFHRVLAPGGHALIITRSTGDSRLLLASEKAGHTAVVPDGDDVPWKEEAGMMMSYLSRDDVTSLFASFSRLELERMTFTQGGGKYVNDDWLIFATK
jgi:SAM-dependent methyltransferase